MTMKLCMKLRFGPCQVVSSGFGVLTPVRVLVWRYRSKCVSVMNECV